MPKATKKSNCVSSTYPNEDQEGFNNNEGHEEFNNEQEAVSENELQEDYNNLHESSSDDPDVSFNSQPSTSHRIKEVPHMNMYMPYIEGPTMDWTVNDGLYNRFLKWKLKCENILECELAMQCAQ